MEKKNLSDLERELLKSLFQNSPAASDELEVRAFGDDSNQGVRYFVYYDVLDELTFASDYHDQPSIAVLLGGFSMDEKGAFIEVTGFTALEYMPDSSDLFEVIKGAVIEAIGELNQGATAGGRHVVGLYYGAAGNKGRLDEVIARAHLSLFNMPFQLAMIVDPEQECIGHYARPVGGRFFNAGFSVVRMKTAPGDEIVKVEEVKESDHEVRQDVDTE
ncbi:MAG: hypothetical protein ACNA8W_11890 [Bradymonadaceae bacterium]